MWDPGQARGYVGCYIAGMPKRCIMVMFDSLNRHLLPPYAADTFIKAPNFQRLAKRAVTFDTSYVCSMPCMPARRDFHTGRPNFLHTPWSPLQPYDDSVPAMLSDAGIYTHLTTDHYHYFEDGGATYHGRYDSWDFYRGQEGDPFVGQVTDPVKPENLNSKGRRQDWVNRQFLRHDEQMPQTLTFRSGLDFIDRNAKANGDWFLQIECFDPHEPFYTDQSYVDQYPSDYDGPLLDWPAYGRNELSDEQLAELRRRYAALVTKCDTSLGRVLDAMDRHAMWDDTMLVVWTDHGFMLGEHGWLAKNIPPMYDEISNTPFFVWDPRNPGTAGEHREAVVQPAIDLGPTLLRYFGQQPTERMLGHDLEPVITDDTSVRDAAIWGYHGQDINITDGRYTYFRRPVHDTGGPLNDYTLVPTMMRGFRDVDADKTTLAPPFDFTKNMPLLKLELKGRTEYGTTPTPAPGAEHLLFDKQKDPSQNAAFRDEAIEARLCEQMTALMQACDAPAEQYERVGLTRGSGTGERGSV